jgi:hypothetical protein
MKNLLIIVFCKINYNKIERKGDVQKTFTIMLFDLVNEDQLLRLMTCLTSTYWNKVTFKWNTNLPNHSLAR